MESLLLAVLCLSGWFIAPSCPLRQYHFVNEHLAWYEAQAYCRQKYLDLATIENMTEINQLIDTVTSNGGLPEVWIGLYTKIDWRWSDGSGAEFRKWGNGEPNFWPDQFCVSMRPWGDWYDFECYEGIPFICDKGNGMTPEFVFVDIHTNWTNAQKYCRENYRDLATLRDPSDNMAVSNMIDTEGVAQAWLGISRNPNFFWSDRSTFSFSFWNYGASPIGTYTALCGSAASQNSGKWGFYPCDTKLPFVCQTSTVQERKVLKLGIKLDDSSVDPNDPAVKAELLKRFQDKLKENGLKDVTLVWKEQPDGKVFHKEEDNSDEKMKRKKSEL